MASGVTFRTPGPPDADRVFAFLCQNFFPDAPIIRSIGIACGEDDSLVSRLLRPLFLRLLRKKFVEAILCEPSSVVAEDEADGQIVGLRLARVVDVRSPSSTPAAGGAFSLSDRLFDLGLGRMLGWILPDCLYRMLLCVRMVGPRHMRADPGEAAEDTGCEKIYYGEVLVTHRDARRSGLGRRLVDRSLSLARSLGCGGCFVFATGDFSSRIFASSGFLTLRTVCYSDPDDPDFFADDFGRAVVVRAAPHARGRTMFRRLDDTGETHLKDSQ